MRLLLLLQLAAAAAAFVIPDEETLNSLALDKQEHPAQLGIDNAAEPLEDELWQELDDEFVKSVIGGHHKFDDAVDSPFETTVEYGEKFEDAFAGQAWLETAEYDLDLVDGPDGPPHHGPGHGKPPHRKPPHKRPHHPPHRGKSNLTVYQLISKSKYTTKLAALINEFDDLVELLNGTSANFTLFAPTDKAFEKIPKGAPKPPKEFLKKLLTYHVSPEFYPAGRVLFSRTIPTSLEASAIGKVPQRIRTEIGFRGLTLNFYSRVVAANIFASNGVIHGVDSILFPPPKAAKIIQALPGEFSTLELALLKTGLFKYLNDTSSHSGGTLFAPSNFAFKRLGPKINAFLFSKFGEKYLKALLLYHTVENITLYSDALYKIDALANDADDGPHRRHGVPKGFFHVDLPTCLEGKSLSVDVARYGRFITIKINGFNRVSVLDGIAADGVIHVVPSILIPPKTPGMPGSTGDEEISVEELIERLEPHLDVVNEGGEDDEAEYNFEL